MLEVFDPASGMLCNSHQAVTPCFLEACDPRVPYRVLNNTVTFLTFEDDQGEDLNGDGDTDDLVLQTFNVAMAEAAGMCASGGAGSLVATARMRTAAAPVGVHAGLVTTLAGAAAGVEHYRRAGQIYGSSVFAAPSVSRCPATGASPPREARVRAREKLARARRRGRPDDRNAYHRP